MSLKIAAISLTVAVLLMFSLCGCMSIDDGVYDFDSNGGAATSPESVEPFVTTSPITAPEPETTAEPPATYPESTAPIEPEPLPSTEPAETAAPEDMIEPLAAVIQRDYSALDTESHGYGQGVRFDNLNRPKGASNSITVIRNTTPPR